MISELVQYEDLKDMLFGELLGVGIHRKVGVWKPDPTLVIKCALEDPTRNIIEWEIWEAVKRTKIAKWFTPCVSISTCGMFLLQKRVEHRPRAEYPKEIPAFFSDCKYKNYGWLNGQLVCCDYAGFGSIYMGNFKVNTRMKKADWWE